MYNQEIKVRFMSDNALNKSYVSKRGILFEDIGKYESFLKKDIAEMSKHEANLAINSLGIREYSTASFDISVLKAYVKWCISNGYFTESTYGVLELSIDDIDPSVEYARLIFRDENELIYSMRKVRSLSDGYPEVMFLILAWVGIDRDYALELKDTSVDLENRKIYGLDGSVIVDHFSDDILHIMQDYVRCNFSTRDNGTTTFEVIKDRSLDRFIKRFCPRSSDKMGTPLTDLQIKSAMFKMNRAYEELGYAPRFTYTNVQESGGLYRIWQLEQSGVDVFAKKNIPLVLSAFGKSKQYTKVIWKYKFYKKAFNL